MIIDIDLTGGNARIDLVEPEDCKRFHVTARARGTGGVPPTTAAGAASDSDAEALGAALAAHDVGRLLPSGDALIDTQAVRRMAEGRVPEGWDGEFAAMLKYADSKGWLDDTGSAIQAHVEWAG